MGPGLAATDRRWPGGSGPARLGQDPLDHGLHRRRDVATRRQRATGFPRHLSLAWARPDRIDDHQGAGPVGQRRHADLVRRGRRRAAQADHDSVGGGSDEGQRAGPGRRPLSADADGRLHAPPASGLTAGSIWRTGRRQACGQTPSSSTSKISVAFGGMTPPAPRAP
ncbi:hypothetical protein BWR60_05140 [Inquilinus limosus]|uniref:Uncharacterized protein n=1 Tax=Inquilinus limosus TaxID=171674 RepID=A0A211ZSX9_9PROT|nr:hypothetical protein BWR60_05140 [Inquilinus limosus]